jgi:hypothetical protein
MPVEELRGPRSRAVIDRSSSQADPRRKGVPGQSRVDRAMMASGSLDGWGFAMSDMRSDDAVEPEPEYWLVRVVKFIGNLIVAAIIHSTP